MSELWSYVTAGKELGVSRWCVADLVARQGIPTRRVGAAKVIDADGMRRLRKILGTPKAVSAAAS